MNDLRKADLKVRARTSKTIPALRVTKRGILTRNRDIHDIQKGKTDPFNVVSRNLAEQSASVFERYKHLVKRGD